MTINRRDFLKIFGMSVAATAIPSFIVSERERCEKDIIYFAETYCFYGNVKLKKWQKDYLKYLVSGKSAIINAFRCSGKSVMNIIYCVWYNTFKDNKSVALVTSTDTKAICSKYNLLWKISDKNAFKNADSSICKELINKFHNIDFVGAYKVDCNKKYDLVVLDDFTEYYADSVKPDSNIYKLMEKVLDSNSDTQVVFSATTTNRKSIFGRMCEECEYKHQGFSDGYFKITCDMA